MSIRDQLISAGIKNLNTFGYPNVTKENILSDLIYKEFFKSMLNDTLNNGEVSIEINAEINQLLMDIE